MIARLAPKLTSRGRRGCSSIIDELLELQHRARVAQPTEVRGPGPGRPRPWPLRALAQTRSIPVHLSVRRRTHVVAGNRRQLLVSASEPARERRRYSEPDAPVAPDRRTRTAATSSSWRRTRAWASPRRPGPRVRALLPRRQGSQRGRRGDGPRPLDRPSRDGQPRWRGERLVRSGEGSTFTLRLPRRCRPPPTPQTSRRQVDAAEQSRPCSWWRTRSRSSTRSAWAAP